MSFHIVSIDAPNCSLSCRNGQSTCRTEGSVRAWFLTRVQWEAGFVLHGSPAEEIPPEESPEQIQLW